MPIPTPSLQHKNPSYRRAGILRAASATQRNIYGGPSHPGAHPLNSLLHPLPEHPSESAGSVIKYRFLPESTCWRVVRSWKLIENDLDQIGLSFFADLFKSRPDLLSLFPFGKNLIDPVTGKADPFKIQTSPFLRRHGKIVMVALGNMIENMNDIDVLTPRLRALGRSHALMGITEDNFNALAKSLIGAVRDAVGPSNWDSDVEEAWMFVYNSLTTIMQKPLDSTKRESLCRWNQIILVASIYLVFATPFQMAGFAASSSWANVLLCLGNFIAALCFAIDFMSEMLSRVLARIRSQGMVRTQRPTMLSRHSKELRPWSRRFRDWFREQLFWYRFRLVRVFRRMELVSWIPWPKLDIVILGSFVLQHFMLFRDLGRGLRSANIAAPWRDFDSFSSFFVPIMEKQNRAGVHVTYLFGLLRVLPLLRIYHIAKTAESNELLSIRLDRQNREYLQMAKLTLVLIFITHLSACLWCITARFGLGADNLIATEPTSFFPDPFVLMGTGGVASSYFRSIHWAWVALAGIGNNSSEPDTMLETFVTLFVHFCGATLYAVTTGNIISALQDSSQNVDDLGANLFDLVQIMDECRIPPSIQEVFISGYIMNDFCDGQDLGGVRNEFEKTDFVIPDRLKQRLPGHLRKELELYSVSEILQRRDAIFRKCSVGFLFMIAGSLNETDSILAGDYFMREHGPPLDDIVVIVSGEMTTSIHGKILKSLKRGDIIGKQYLILGRGSSITTCPNRFLAGHVINEVPFTGWYYSNTSESFVSVRAMTNCTLAKVNVKSLLTKDLRKMFPADINVLEKAEEETFDGMKALIESAKVGENVAKPSMNEQSRSFEETSVVTPAPNKKEKLKRPLFFKRRPTGGENSLSSDVKNFQISF